MPEPRPTPSAGAPLPPGLAELFRTSLLLGLMGFGGGITVLGAIENLVVQRRRWLSEADFATVATVAQMLPGGAAANALATIGLRFHRVPGAAAAYAGFVLPGALLVLALAALYARFGAVPDADAFLSGLNAAVVGIILAIAVRMSRTSIRRLWQMGVAAFALVLALVGGAGSGEVALLGIAAGLLWELGGARARLLRRRRFWRPAPPVALPEEGAPLRPSSSPPVQTPAAPPEGPPAGPGPEDQKGGGGTLQLPAALALAIAAPVFAYALAGLAELAVVFLRTGLGAYGGGFAIIPALQAQVSAHGWLTERQFADAVAVGKLTPGPVLLMATFIGYLKAGVAGALVSTAAIFAAPFVLVVALAAWLEQVRANRWMRAALRGLTPAVVGLMMAAALALGTTLRSGAGAAIAAAVGLTLIRFERVNPVVLLALGGLARVVLRLVGGV